jgi:methylenetetrahydrofolate reductase (NADPH)
MDTPSGPVMVPTDQTQILKSGSRLERVLRSGRFAITAELNPPDSADPQAVYDAALVLAEVADGINATDASGANVHMSSVAICALLTRAGYEPILQVSCRDRNRIAIQGDLLGAAAMGVKNVLCLTGDDVSVGDQPEAKRVFDFDSIRLLHTAVIMRDKGIFLSGRKLEVKPGLFLGAASNPFVPPYDWRPLRLAKKIEAGADFIQTQYCFDVARFRQFMQQVRDLGLHERVFILVGVGPLRSEKAAEFMRTKVPGVVIPDDIVERLRRTPKEKKVEEGKRICIEIIQQVREIEGVAGIHMMAYRQEELVAEIVGEAGLLPRPRLKPQAVGRDVEAGEMGLLERRAMTAEGGGRE